MKQQTSTVRQEAAMQQILQRMPNEVAESFTDEQLLHLKIALGARKWSRHKLDLRGTFGLPFSSTHYYYVLLCGKNIRELSRAEAQMSRAIKALILLATISLSLMLGLCFLYVIKSALGINIFEDYSLGLWS
ncbi:hypothetical protein [Catenovulum maritimum]|uniref:3-phosphoshikimate 1-carboxyvinyltransferase n=1 Tax=Catenovulum maritimum TaxID=1513271 RepID=A0A0J8JJ40_9ALTE|nr:hypothetical protein [Catenovulum maritimum]KMT64461.1 hypothetical protein XM47_14310 [Catenovulum maritimum]